MNKWQRINYQPVLPLGKNGCRLTGSKEHIELSRSAATEGMVLLKNEDNALPLANGAKIALFGKGCIDYVKGGGGSGNVLTDYVHNIADGFLIKETEGKVSVFNDTVEFYTQYCNKQYEEGYMKGLIKEPELPVELVDKAKAYTDTAIISFSRYSGEGWDRRIGKDDDIRIEYTLFPGEAEEREIYHSVYKTNDFYLTDEEIAMLELVKANFKKVIVIINAGGVVDTNWTLEPDISAVLMAWQSGMEGGLAVADILCGDVNPSGHLTDTFAKNLSDYPSTEGFHTSADYVEYKDDIFVGYRYFSTIPGASECVNYPFGYGLSYTTFDIETEGVKLDGETITFDIKVSNTGRYPGKEVVQVYFGAPQGKLSKAARELAAFAKTGIIDPGESESLTLSIPIKDMRCFDDTGKVKEASWVLEKGLYRFYIGNNVRDAKESDFTYTVDEDIILETTGHKVAPSKLTERLLADGSKEKMTCTDFVWDENKLEKQVASELEGWHPGNRHVDRICIIAEDKPLQFIDVANGLVSMDDFIGSLTLEDKIDLLGGQSCTGIAITCGVGNNRVHGIPNVMTADGPAGLRTKTPSGVTATAWPVAVNLAATWNMDLLEQVGKEIALEIKENNLGLWLAPACNIHRSPLCGRNFEYYSEDPYLSGKAAIAIINGTQSQGIGATPKHFAANNKETNRKASDSVVSERALREIYLKQFEMIVKESNPYMIMSAYNKINGIPASENKELITGILRDEWGYEGPVSSDWWTLGEHYLEAKAGNDIKMANGYPERVKEAYDMGLISDEEIDTCVKRILNMIIRLD